MSSATLDEADLHAFIGRFLGDLAATHHAATVVLGDRLGLYRALADTAPATAAEVAAAASCHERYVREWLNAQAASRYCEYDPETGRYSFTPAQQACLAEDGAETFVAAGTYLAASLFKDEPLVAEAFRSGNGVAWGAHHHDLFAGVERFFRPGYLANLTTSWIPALDGVEDRLAAGIKVADIGCGHGASSILLAQAYPASTVIGFDSHEASIEAARAAATEADRPANLRFDVASAQSFPGGDFGLVCTFDALHDMGDPVGAARRIREALDADGTWLLVEPAAGESVADNVHPVGRLFYSASTFICTPSARSQPGGYALGAQASEAQLRHVTEQAGFTRFRRAVDTPVNRIFEIRP